MQLTLDNKTKDQVAIERLQQYEPKEGYYLAFSGGKDSTCIYHLALKAKVKFDAHYSVTGIDPPELVKFIKTNYPDVKFEMPKMSIWRYIEKKGLPTRKSRWCCDLLKESKGNSRTVITGIRAEESINRRDRGIVEVSKKRTDKLFIHAIIDWTLLDVWNFIDSYNLPYCSLYETTFNRLGCIGCPLGSHQQYEFRLYPKISEAWKRAARRFYDKQGIGVQRFNSFEEYWGWWLSGLSIKEYTKQNQGRMNLNSPESIREYRETE